MSAENKFNSVFDIHPDDTVGWSNEARKDAEAKFKTLSAAERIKLGERIRGGDFDFGKPERDSFDPLLFDQVLFPTEEARRIYINTYMAKMIRMWNLYRARRADLNLQQGLRYHAALRFHVTAQNQVQYLHWGGPSKSAPAGEKSKVEAEKPKASVPTVRKSFSRRFVLNRNHDATGTSGTGIVAEGVVFSCGKVALTWFSHYGAVNNYDSMEVVKVLHGHEGSTQIEWIDAEAV